jgi:peptidyl-prolyl cis-trans isomerase SurA
VMQSKITKDISATPNDVRTYFESIPKDSIPYIDAEMEVAHIVRIPSTSEEEKLRIKEQLEDYRKKVLDGGDFSVYAALYSDDKSTAKKGGDLGYFSRGTMVPEFEGAAYNLKPGEMSPIVETKFGYHLIQMIDRRGDQINVRHILLQPKISDEDLQKSYKLLDSLSDAINAGTISFNEAAQKFSDEKETRNNGGLLINAENNTTHLSPDKMDRMLFFQVDTMSLNRVSKPLLMQTAEGKTLYHLVMVKGRSAPHKANLKDDYQKIQEVVVQEKQAKALNDWVEKKRKTTYIQVLSDFGICKESLSHWNTADSNTR